MARQKRYNGLLRKTFTYNGKRVYIYGKTPQELLDNEVKKREELQQGYTSLYNPTLKAYYDRFTEIRRSEVRESTLRSQKRQFKTIAGVEMAKGITFGDMNIKDITRHDIETARDILLKAGKSAENLNICFKHLNHVFHSAVLDDTITKNPCQALKELKRTAASIGDTKHRALSESETKAFFDAAGDRNSFYINAFLLMIKSGMRVGEVCALYPTDIDIKKGFIHVRRTITRDEVGGYVVGENAKTKSGQRDIPLTDDMIEIIRKQQELNRMVFGLDRGGLLFRSSEGDILREYTINREIKRICMLADIDYFTCHAFRNTFATRFIEQRPQDYKILSEILGHKDISITLNLYTHVMQENKVTAMKELNIKVI